MVSHPSNHALLRGLFVSHVIWTGMLAFGTGPTLLHSLNALCCLLFGLSLHCLYHFCSISTMKSICFPIIVTEGATRFINYISMLFSCYSFFCCCPRHSHTQQEQLLHISQFLLFSNYYCLFPSHLLPSLLQYQLLFQHVFI